MIGVATFGSPHLSQPLNWRFRKINSLKILRVLDVFGEGMMLEQYQLCAMHSF
jgi:hypothetical protein